MKSRKLVIGLLIMLAFVVSSFTFAYWSNVNLSDSEVGNAVSIGRGREGSIGVSTAGIGNLELVPDGEIGNSVLVDPENTLVDFIVFEFEVTWTDDFDTLTGTLEAEVIDVKINESALFANFVETTVVVGGAGFDVNGNRVDADDEDTEIEVGTAVTVYVKVVLLMPADVVGSGTDENPEYTAEDVYNAIATEVITFTVSFLVEVLVEED
jgi:hypothetical protein